MANLCNLKQPVDKFKGIGISPDLHPKEREEIKHMINEAKQAHIGSSADGDGAENYRFLAVGHSQRQRVIITE